MAFQLVAVSFAEAQLKRNSIEQARSHTSADDNRKHQKIEAMLLTRPNEATNMQNTPTNRFCYLPLRAGP